MYIICPACQARYRFDEAKLGDRTRARTRCTRCGGPIDIVNPRFLSPDVTLPPGPMEAGPARNAAGAPPQATGLPTTEKTQPTMLRPRTLEDDDPLASRGPRPETGPLPSRGESPALPPDKRLSLAVLQGSSTGQIHALTRPRVVIGRRGGGADIELDDPEISRHHASLEVHGEEVVLRDLGSTNGTFVDYERVEEYALQNQMEFRVGSHVMMLIVTSVD